MPQRVPCYAKGLIAGTGATATGLARTSSARMGPSGMGPCPGCRGRRSAWLPAGRAAGGWAASPLAAPSDRGRRLAKGCRAAPADAPEAVNALPMKPRGLTIQRSGRTAPALTAPKDILSRRIVEAGAPIREAPRIRDAARRRGSATMSGGGDRRRDPPTPDGLLPSSRTFGSEGGGTRSSWSEAGGRADPRRTRPGRDARARIHRPAARFGTSRPSGRLFRRRSSAARLLRRLA